MMAGYRKVGSFDWEACEECKYFDPKEGECSLDVYERSKDDPGSFLWFNGNDILCGKFETR